MTELRHVVIMWVVFTVNERTYKLFLRFLAEFDVMPKEIQDKVLIVLQEFRKA